MKVVAADTLKSIDDYRLINVTKPQPGLGEVVVRVAACGVGYVDALVALGRYQVKPPLPHTPGQEIAGWVASIGPEAQGFRVGDRVLASVRGGFAEYVTASVAAVHRIPDRMRLTQAAGFHINYVTALHALRDRANLQKDETVLVFGAAGGLGAAGVQVAKLLGARVVAVASSDAKRAFCRELGSDELINTQPEGWRDRLRDTCGGRGPDVVFDPVCGPLFEPAFRSLAWRGRHLVLGFVGGPIPTLRVNLSLMKGAALVGVDVRQFGLFEPEAAKAYLHHLLDWIGEGRLTPPSGRMFQLEDYAEALEFALSGKGLGKTIVTIAQNGHER